jgi:hypothetical protein
MSPYKSDFWISWFVRVYVYMDLCFVYNFKFETLLFKVWRFNNLFLEVEI